MSEERFANLEKGQAKLTADFRVMSHDLAGVKTDVGELKGQGSEILRAMRNLETKAATQPAPFTGKVFLVTLGSIAAGAISLFLVIWAIIQASPPVADLDKRLTKLDDDETGKVTIIYEKLRALEAQPTSPPQRRPPKTKPSSFLFPF